MIREVLCDIDGTLVTPIGKLHPDDLNKNRYALKRTMEKRKVGLITGRELSGTNESALERYLQFNLNGVVIAENGAVILENAWIFDEIYSEYQNVNNHLIKIGGLNQIENVKNILRTNGFLKRMKIDEKKQHIVTLYKKRFCLENFTDLYEKAKKLLPKLDITYSPVSIDISTKKTNKGNAVKEYAKRNGLNLNEIAVFGDAKNDESMFDVVLNEKGLGFYVGKDKNMAEWITSFVGGYANPRGMIATRNYLLKLNEFEEFTKYRQFMRDNY